MSTGNKAVPIQLRSSSIKSNEEVESVPIKPLKKTPTQVRPSKNECVPLKLLCFWRSKDQIYTQEQFEAEIHKLHKFCLIHLQDSYRVHLNRLKGLELLEELLIKINFSTILPVHVMSLIWCTLSCIHHFYIRLRARSGLMNWSRRPKSDLIDVTDKHIVVWVLTAKHPNLLLLKNQAKRAMVVYDTLIISISPDLCPNIVHAIITFYTESKMWNTEYLCAELLKTLFYNSSESEDTVHAILDVAEKWSISNIRGARQVIQVLYQVLHDYSWSNIDSSLIMRLLMMFYQSIIPEPRSNYNFVPLRKGLEVCLRNIVENLPSEDLIIIIKTMIEWTFDEKISNEAILDFGNLLEYAANLHKTFLYRDTFQKDLLPLILKLISSQNGVHSLLGNRVFQFLMDRHNNKISFDTPRIYFDNMNYHVYISQYNSEDKSFIRKYREMIHSTFLKSIQLHGVHRINLESTYASMAIVIVEVPCGYTAAALVCLAMAIQEYTISDDTLELECSHRLHATVMAIMSLVCWVHSAQIFYEYLNTVLSRRAQFAPHLNPPFKANYQYAQHHVLWNKPELFFEDWEARYGLWKCFRTKRGRVETYVTSKGSQQDIV